MKLTPIEMRVLNKWLATARKPTKSAAPGVFSKNAPSDYQVIIKLVDELLVQLETHRRPPTQWTSTERLAMNLMADAWNADTVPMTVGLVRAINSPDFSIRRPNA